MQQPENKNSPYKIDAPQYAPTTGPAPLNIEEGEIVYGNQNFSNTYIDATSEILESGQKFWQDINSLNQQRLQLNAREKADKYKRWDDTRKEEMVAQANRDLAKKEWDREFRERMRLLNERKKTGDDLYGTYGGLQL